MKKVLTGILMAGLIAWLPSTGAWAQVAFTPFTGTNSMYSGPYSCSVRVSPEISSIIAFCETHKDDTFCRGVSAVSYGNGIPLGERFTEQYKVVPSGSTGLYANGKLNFVLDQGCSCLFTLDNGSSSFQVYAPGYGFETLEWQPYEDNCGGQCSNFPFYKNGFTDDTSFLLHDITGLVTVGGPVVAQGTQVTDDNLNGMGEAGSGSCQRMILQTP